MADDKTAANANLGKGLDDAYAKNDRALGAAMGKASKKDQKDNQSYAAELGQALGQHAKQPGQRFNDA